MSLRKAMTLLAIVSALALAAPMAASAATAPQTATVSTLNKVPVTGAAKNGKKFTGHMAVTDFVTRNGHTYAVGTLTGKLGNRSIKATQASVPASVPAPASGTASAAAACPVLHLVLGPLNLNLLGVVVTLNQVVLDVTAQSGPGNLLGNLVCSLSNLLNTQSVLGQELSGLLNVVNSLLGSPAALQL